MKFSGDVKKAMYLLLRAGGQAARDVYRKSERNKVKKNASLSFDSSDDEDVEDTVPLVKGKVTSAKSNGSTQRKGVIARVATPKKVPPPTASATKEPVTKKGGGTKKKVAAKATKGTAKVVNPSSKEWNLKAVNPNSDSVVTTNRRKPVANTNKKIAQGQDTANIQTSKYIIIHIHTIITHSNRLFTHYYRLLICISSC